MSFNLFMHVYRRHLDNPGLDTRASFVDAVEELKDDDSNEENIAPDLAQVLLEWVPACLCAVALNKVDGCAFIVLCVISYYMCRYTVK
jgi:hypothetical protein